MPRVMKPKGKKVSGADYAEVDEVFNKKMAKKDAKGMKAPGLALKLKISEKEEGYSKKPRVKPQKKMAKPVIGQKKVY